MAASGYRGRCITDLAGLKASLYAAGCTGGIILGGIGQYGQLVKNIHASLSGTASAGIVDTINEAHQVDCNASGT